MRTFWPAMPPSPKKSPEPKMATTASLPPSFHNGEFDVSFLDIHDRIRSLALRENGLLLAELLNLSRCPVRLEKDLRNESDFLLRFHIWMFTMSSGFPELTRVKI
jgi:hypothetical protein